VVVEGARRDAAGRDAARPPADRELSAAQVSPKTGNAQPLGVAGLRPEALAGPGRPAGALALSRFLEVRVMNRPLVPVAAAVLLAAAFVPTAGEAQSFSRVLQCSGGDFFTLRLTATYTEQTQGKTTVKQIDVDLEADKKSGFKSGQKVTFLVDGKKIGAATFSKDANGDLDADVKRRSTGGSGFPTVKSGSKVTAEVRDVTVATCKMP
jgi:hypothetical protein